MRTHGWSGRRALLVLALAGVLVLATRHTAPEVVPGAGSALASAVEGETVGGYLADHAQDTWTYAADTALHPRSVLQNTLGFAVSLGTAGERGQGSDGTWAYYENASGLGVAIPELFGQEAITIGNFVFSEESLTRRRELYWHEYRHYRQSTAFGPLFLLAYAITHATHGYADSPFEEDARDWGRQRARTPRPA